MSLSKRVVVANLRRNNPRSRKHLALWEQEGGRRRPKKYKRRKVVRVWDDDTYDDDDYHPFR